MKHYSKPGERLAQPLRLAFAMRHQIHPEPRPSHSPHLVSIEKAFQVKARTHRRRFEPEDIICSRALDARERKKVLALLKPGRPSLSRCAAAHVIAELGMVKALPLFKKMLNQGISSPSVRGAFEFAVMRIEGMKRHRETPHAHEHIAILRGMMCSHQDIVRFLAQKVLAEADIKHGTVPGWTLPSWESEKDFRDDTGETPARTRKGRLAPCSERDFRNEQD